MSHKINVDGCNINQVARWYFGQELYVNRRYQRKLVWTLEEKQLFINSIMSQFPTPAIIINHYERTDMTGKAEQVYEIVDGLQRLDAIFSFIRGDFGVRFGNSKDIKYFDISAIPSASVLKKDRKWKEHSNLLPIDTCLDFADSELPVILTGQEQEKIEEIFRRINSKGRKISSHDLRQAGSSSEFADLVRRIASDIRVDCTYEDCVWLGDMSQISVGPKEHGFGVDIETVFWRRHELVTKPGIRESKDEEIIACLLATVLLGEEFKKSKAYLDALYDRSTKPGKNIENLVVAAGKECLEEKFVETFDVIDNVFTAVGSTFSDYLFSEKVLRNKDECFKMLFLAVYHLLEEQYCITDYKKVAECIKDSCGVFAEFTRAQEVDYKKEWIETNNLYKMLKPAFSKSVAVKKDLPIVSDLDERLSRSILERQMTEFKIGISEHNSDTVNYKCIEKIAKTLVAMANTKENETEDTGMVLIGVADSKEAFDRWCGHYGTNAVIVRQHYVPGIECEAKKLFGDVDTYYRKVRKLLEDMPISSKLKEYVLQNFEVIDYHGAVVMILKSKNVGEISLFDGCKYVRHSNETVLIK